VKYIIISLLSSIFGTIEAQLPIPKVVLVIADGIPADVMERLQPPAMQQLIKEGQYTRAFVGGKTGTYSQTPTISAPGYNDMLTGTWAYKHNVWDNDKQHPDYNYPSIFRLLKSSRPESRTAIFSTWIENRKTLLGEDLPATGKLHTDYVFDGYEKDTVRFPHDTASAYLHHIDEYVVHCADSVIRKNGPELSWIYLEYTDDVGHSKGTGSAFDSAIGMLDNQMRKIAEAIHFRETHYNEQWLLLITTDHGRDSITGMGHGDQSDRERTTWMILNKPVGNAYFFSMPPAIVDVLPSVADYLHIPIKASVARELDGVPFTGPVSVSNAQMTAAGDSLTVTWKSFIPGEKIKIYISFTNNIHEGKQDEYKLIGKIVSSAGTFSCSIPALAEKTFYKVIIEAKYNSLNIWHIEKALQAGTNCPRTSISPS
jgi:hypothetical protein